MITGTSTNFTALVTGTEIVGAWRVGMTLPAGPYSDVSLAVDSLEIDASTTSDMPQDTRLQVGYPTMQATVTLSGLVDQSDETRTAAWLFNPYNAASPLYRNHGLYAPLTIDLGLQTDNAAGTSTQGTAELVRKFTGYVDAYVLNDDGSVTFTCLEQVRQQLRGQATLPPLLNVPVTSEYLIDYLLRSDTQGTISSWPKQITKCLLAVGMRTSTLPEAGLFGSDYSPTYAAGAFGSALSGGALQALPHFPDGEPAIPQYVAADYYLSTPYVLGGATDSKGNATSTGFFAEFWVTGDVSTVFPTIALSKAPSGSLGAGWASSWFLLTVKSTGLQVSSNLFATQTWTISIPAGTHYVGWWMRQTTATTLDIAVVLDGVVNLFTTLTVTIGTTARNYVAVGWSAATGATSTIEALQVSSNIGNLSPLAGGLGSYPFVPTAVLDPSLNTVRVLQAVTGDTYSVTQQLADAELAVAGGDEAGRFRFFNRNTLRSAASVRTVTSAASLASVGGIQIAAASVVNHCAVDWSGWDLSSTIAPVYSATTPLRVPAGQSSTLTLTLDAPAVLLANVIVGSLEVLLDGSTDNGFFYRASTSRGGARENTNVSGTVRQTAANTLEVTIHNNNSTSDAWLVSPANYLDVPAGTPLLRIDGYTWTQTSGVEEVQYPFAADGGAVISRFADQFYSPPGNQFIQDPATAFTLATDIVSDQANPRPDLIGVEIVPDPRLQLADVVRIQDSDWTGVDEYARIFGWNIKWSPGDYSMTLDARTLAPPAGWIMGVGGRSEIGSTAYVYSST